MSSPSPSRRRESHAPTPSIVCTGPSGSAELSVLCDGAAHEVSVVPLSNVGEGAPESETVSSG